MKLAFIDVEVAPNIATIWGIWNQNIGINQLQETSRILCYTAKWYGDRHSWFGSEYDMGHKGMIQSLWQILDEADVVCHYNGKRFDIPVINREFLKYGLTPPSPYKQIDLLMTVKKQFRFVSNKLDHVCDELGIGKKLAHAGHELWLQCMAGDAKAWKTMEKYNIQDVELIVELYEKLRPWITDHPNMALYMDGDTTVCPNCGSSHVHKRGIARTKVFSYQRYQCKDCGTWSRARTSSLTAKKKASIITQESF